MKIEVTKKKKYMKWFLYVNNLFATRKHGSIFEYFFAPQVVFDGRIKIKDKKKSYDYFISIELIIKRRNKNILSR